MRIRDLLRRLWPGSRSLPTQIVDGNQGSTARQSVAEMFDDLVRQAVASGADDDKIRTALDHATQAAAEAMAENLRADAPRMLAEHARIQKGFEQRLYLRWRPALDLFEAVRTCCLEVGENFYMEHRSAIDPKLSALTLLHARACLVSSEVQGLLRTGHAAGAQGRWRTLHELAVIALLLGSSDTDIAERFLNHRAVERYKDARQYQDHCEALGYERFSQDFMDSLERERDELVSRYDKQYKEDWGWAEPLRPPKKPLNFVTLEELAGLAHFRPWYRLSNHAIHSGATGAVHIRGFYGHGDVMLAGPSNGGLADPGAGALYSLYQVTTALVVNGSSVKAERLDLIQLKAIAVLLDEAWTAFMEIHHELEAEQAEIDEQQADPRSS